MNYQFTNNLILDMGYKETKIIYIDDEEYVWCSREKEYVHYSQFSENKKGDYKLFCDECGKLIYEERNINYIHGAKERNDYIQKHSKIMLTNIGYDYNSEYSIHQQFLMKHNLI